MDFSILHIKCSKRLMTIVTSAEANGNATDEKAKLIASRVVSGIVGWLGSFSKAACKIKHMSSREKASEY